MAEQVEDIFAVPIEEPLNSETLAAALFHGTLHLEHLAERLNSQFGPEPESVVREWQEQTEEEKDFWRKISLELIQHARHRPLLSKGGQDGPS